MALPHEAVLCGAKTRQGHPCRQPVIEGRNRCHYHGGKSPRGQDHPKYKHGGRSIEGMRLMKELRELIRSVKGMF